VHERDVAAEVRSTRRLRGYLTATISLSRAQALAGFVAALVSIAGTLFGYVNATRTQYGSLLMLVRDRQTDQPLPDAIVEVLTPTDALVTTFLTRNSNAARHSLKEGMYRVRVMNPRFTPETRVVQVIAGETSEIRFLLSPRTPSPSDRPVVAVPPVATTATKAAGTTTATAATKAAAMTKAAGTTKAATTTKAAATTKGATTTKAATTTAARPKVRAGVAHPATNVSPDNGPRGLRQDTP